MISCVVFERIELTPLTSSFDSYLATSSWGSILYTVIMSRALACSQPVFRNLSFCKQCTPQHSAVEYSSFLEMAQNCYLSFQRVAELCSCQGALTTLQVLDHHLTKSIAHVHLNRQSHFRFQQKCAGFDNS